MGDFYFAFTKKMLLTESVNVEDINSAIDNHNRIMINYQGDNNEHAGPRLIEVYAYGLTKAGNPVIRAFQPIGDTKTTVPHWKFFRLDRISSWKPTKQTFTKPANYYYKGLGDFNETDDKTMSVVYKIADFNNDKDLKAPVSTPKTKEDSAPVYKTDTEERMERLRQQMDNPITLDDLKIRNGFNNTASEKPESGPKLKTDSQPVEKAPQSAEPEVYRTDTERGMDRLRQQLDNPITLDDYLKRNNGQQTQPKSDTTDDIEKMRSKLGDTTEPISFAELNGRLSDKKPETQSAEPAVYRTDTERGMDRLRQQLDNPRKIDLSRIPKR